jgi:DNA-directed RNA polymerase specialized sigma24 family protein
VTRTPLTSDVCVETKFLKHLPRIRNHATYALRHVANRDDRDDMVCEALALAWKHFTELSTRGKRPETFVTTLALRCTQAVRAGRRLAGPIDGAEVLSRVAQVRHGFSVERLKDRVLTRDVVGEDAVSEALAVDPKARVPEQAAFRIDFPAWRSRFGRRHRAVLDALACGDRPGEVAKRHRVSPARVSQIREMFREDWRDFHAGVA